jgi:tetratricopeptide (TPR) repeat protein
MIVSCSRDSAEKIRYDMEKLVYGARKLAEKINIQPQLATTSDSLALKKAYEDIVDYFQQNRNHDLVVGDTEIMNQMGQMAIGAQMELAQYYTAQRQADSVIAAYRKIGTEIPAGKHDIAGATLALALIYRSLGAFDSTYALYDHLLEDYYPPVDSLGRVNTDITAIPVDKIKIARALGDQNRLDAFTQEALDYYRRLNQEYPDNTLITRRALVNMSRVYTMTEQWDEAIGQLQQIEDTTGQIDIAALVLTANIYNGPKKDVSRAIELYRQILEREPDSSIIGTTMLQLGTALCDQEQYDDGRKVLADLKQKYAPYPQLVSKAQFYYAQSFEVQNRWDRALSEFQWLMENHPYSEEAFWAARRIPEHFEKEDNQKLAETWYERAADFYMRAARIKQGQPTEVAAYTYLAELYRITEQWDKAMETLEKIHSIAPGSQLAARALYNAATVAANELGDSLMARDILNRLNREFGTADSTQIYEEEKTDIDLESLE